MTSSPSTTTPGWKLRLERFFVIARAAPSAPWTFDCRRCDFGTSYRNPYYHGWQLALLDHALAHQVQLKKIHVVDVDE